MVDPNTIFIDGTHIKASANKKKYQKEQVAKAAKVYSGQLRREVNEENVVRMKKGKRYTPHISGRSIWIWLNRYAKRNVRRSFMRSAKKPLNGSLQTRKRNTRCVIHTTEAWPRHTMGQAKICCHEPEKAGKLELGALLFRLLFLSASPIFEENPCSRFLKAWVL